MTTLPLDRDIAEISAMPKKDSQSAIPRRIGGGPRLKLAEWATLIHLHQTLGHDLAQLKRAITTASEHLGAEAATTGRPRPGTRLRSTSGLMRRLTVVRAMAAGQRDNLPSEALAAWRLFEIALDESAALAVTALGVTSPLQHVLAHSAAPARGPVPAFGKFDQIREDGTAEVYLMRLAGPKSSSLTGASDGLVYVKLGRSADPSRRLDEMNWSIPPGCGLSWQIESTKTFACVAGAHAFEQALLQRLHASNLTIGGEYALIPRELVQCLLDVSSAPGDKWALDAHLRGLAGDANSGLREARTRGESLEG